MDNPLTLQEAKDQVAKIHYSDKWDKIDWYHLNEINERTEPPYMEEILMKEAAELYARSKWDQACREQRDRCVAQFINSPDVKVNQYTAREYCANAPQPEFKP